MDRPYTLDDETVDAKQRGRDREALRYHELSGPLADRYGMDVYPDGPEGRQAAFEAQQKLREAQGGAPDSSPEMPATAVSQKPFKF